MLRNIDEDQVPHNWSDGHVIKHFRKRFDFIFAPHGTQSLPITSRYRFNAKKIELPFLSN